MITFNVVFTPGTPGRLLPFALSLLHGTGVRLRVIGNGVTGEDLELLRIVPRVDERISSHVLPVSSPIEHGLALNHVFEAFPEPQFAIADSDVIASGDFMPGVWPLAPRQAAVCSAAPVWVTDAEAVPPARGTFLGGYHRVLRDGTPVGGTYFAIYDRAAIEPLWRAAPRGFASHERYLVPRSVQAAFAARGWRYRVLDTGRLLHLQLVVAGYTVENRAVPELHHVGGFSARTAGFRGVPPWRSRVRHLVEIARSNEERRLQQVIDGTQHALYMHWRRSRRDRDPGIRNLRARRRLVSAHVGAVLDAILAGEAVPAAPRTDSAEVDRRLSALTSALELHYGSGVAALRAAA